MTTDTAGLLVAGLDLAEEAWKDANEDVSQDADWYILHQVSKVHTSMHKAVLLWLAMLRTPCCRT